MRKIVLIALLPLISIIMSCYYPGPVTDVPGTALTGYYDLRERSSFIQISNVSEENVSIHVQIFQNDQDCDELNFNDQLTPNDTVIYNMDDLVRNDGTEVPINLNDNSFGYVVVILQDFDDEPDEEVLIGNFRIIDDSGYEYRTNLAFIGFVPNEIINLEINPNENVPPLYANFNTIDGAVLSDVVGYSYFVPGSGDGFPDTVFNYDPGVEFDIFVFDMNEEPLSCDSTLFACGGVMNYGINEDYGSSKGNDLLCQGGGLADPRGGFISFENGRFVNYSIPDGGDDGDPDPEIVPFFVGLIGINNGNGTGSMDYWQIRTLELVGL